MSPSGVLGKGDCQKSVWIWPGFGGHGGQSWKGTCEQLQGRGAGRQQAAWNDCQVEMKTTVRGPGFGRASENDIKTQKCSKEMLEGDGIRPPPWDPPVALTNQVYCWLKRSSSFLLLWPKPLMPPPPLLLLVFGSQPRSPWLSRPPLVQPEKDRGHFLHVTRAPAMGQLCPLIPAPGCVAFWLQNNTHALASGYPTRPLHEHTGRKWIKGPTPT